MKVLELANAMVKSGSFKILVIDNVDGKGHFMSIMPTEVTKNHKLANRER